MFPQLFDAKSKQNAASTSHPLRHHSKLMSQIITHEIHASTTGNAGPRKAAHGVETRRWFYGKDHDHYMRQYETEFEKKRKLFSANDMDEVHAEYLRDRELRDRRLEEQKWHVIFGLEITLQDGKYRNIRLAAGDRALYECMFKVEPRKFISRPKFLTCMRLVYGFELANLDRVCDNDMLERLNTLYTSFDVNGKNEMDWRCFILMLEMCHEKSKTCRSHITWGYCLYSSTGSFDTSCEEPMRLGDVKDLLATMVRVVFRPDMIEVADAAWTNVAATDAEAKGMVKKLKRGVSLFTTT